MYATHIQQKNGTKCLSKRVKCGVIIQHKSCCHFFHIRFVCSGPRAQVKVCMILIYRIEMSVQKKWFSIVPPYTCVVVAVAVAAADAVNLYFLMNFYHFDLSLSMPFSHVFFHVLSLPFSAPHYWKMCTPIHTILKRSIVNLNVCRAQKIQYNLNRKISIYAHISNFPPPPPPHNHRR